MKIFTKITTLILTILGLFLSGSVYAQTIKNAGFTGSEIILSNSVPVVGEMVRMSMPIYNESGGTLTGVVKLYKGSSVIGEKTITLKVGEFSGFSNEWKAEPGTHQFVLKLEDTYIQKPKSVKELIVLGNREAKATIKTQGLSTENSDVLLKEYEIASEEQQIDSGSSIDIYRKDFLADTEARIKFLRQDISESIKQNEEYEKRLSSLKESLPRSDGSLLTPVQYMYAWSLGALSFILSNPYVFYSTVALIILLILRFIIRRIQRRRHYHHH